MLLNIYFARFFSTLYLWYINIYYTLVTQVRYIRQDIQENKYCNILFKLEAAVVYGRCDDLGICLRRIFGLWILYICVIWKTVIFHFIRKLIFVLLLPFTL